MVPKRMDFFNIPVLFRFESLDSPFPFPTMQNWLMDFMKIWMFLGKQRPVWQDWTNPIKRKGYKYISTWKNKNDLSQKKTCLFYTYFSNKPCTYYIQRNNSFYNSLFDAYMLSFYFPHNPSTSFVCFSSTYS